MFITITLPKEVCHLLEPVEDKPEFVCLPSQQLYSYLPSVVKKFQEDMEHTLSTEDYYISPLVIRSTTQKELANLNSLLYTFVNFVKSLGVENVNYSFSKTETSEELMFEFNSSDDSSDSLHGSMDFVSAICLLFWPHQAAGWITRPVTGLQRTLSKQL